MHGRTFRPWYAPVVILTAGACFATRNDMRILQEDLQVVRAERVAADSALFKALEAVVADLGRVDAKMDTMADSARAANATVMRLRGDVREDLQAIRQQLISIQELTGQSQRRIQELRAEMEARAAELSVPDPAAANPSAAPTGQGGATGTTGARGTTGSTTAPSGRPPAPTPPGPAQLYQMGQEQVRAGRPSAARTAFETLLTQFPTHDLAPEALYAVGGTYADEGDGPAADSAYALLVERYPRSPNAPNALLKRAATARALGRGGEARAFYQEIVTKYPQSEAADLAREYLRARP